MAQSPELTYPDIVRLARTFLMMVLAADAIALRPEKPRARGPITPLAEKLFRILLFTFENVLTGLCIPAIATIAGTAGASQSQTKVLLKALTRTEYLTWKHGKRKRVLTRKGWRVVRSANRYRLLCPRRHLTALRRFLVKACKGKHGPLIQAVVSRFTPPSEEEKAAAAIVTALAADLRPNAARTSAPEDQPRETGPPPQSPPAAAGGVEIGGVRVEDPALARVLSGLWAALEERETGEA